MLEAEKDLDYFTAWFTELADDERDHGVSVVVLIENSGAISRQSSMTKVFRGTVVSSVGLLQCALMDFQQR